jgi:hypothetical protein
MSHIQCTNMIFGVADSASKAGILFPNEHLCLRSKQEEQYRSEQGKKRARNKQAKERAKKQARKAGKSTLVEMHQHLHQNCIPWGAV